MHNKSQTKCLSPKPNPKWPFGDSTNLARAPSSSSVDLQYQQQQNYATADMSNSGKSALVDELSSFKRTLEPSARLDYNDGSRTVRVDNDVLAFMSIASKLDPIPSLAIKCRRLIKGHNGKVLCLDWSQDKRHLVSSSQDGKIMVWDAFPNSCKQENCIAVPTTWLMACSFAPSGQFVAAGGLDNKITAYPLFADYNDSTDVTQLGDSSAYLSSANASGAGGAGGQNPSSGATSPGGGSQASGGNPASNNHHSALSGHQAQQQHASQLQHQLQQQVQQQQQAQLQSQSQLQASSLQQPQQQQQLSSQQQQQSQQQAQSQQSQSQSQHSAAYSKRKPIGTHTSYTSCSQFLNNDQQILTGSGDSTCALWNVECGALIQSFYGHSGDVLSLDVSPGEMGNTFVSVGCDKRALIWDTRIGHCGQNQYIQSFKAHKADINSVKYYPSGDSILTGSDDTTCRLYDLRADQEVAVYEKSSILFGINSIDLSISGRILFAAGNDYTIHVWDTLRRNRICVLYGHESRVTCVRVSADGTALASGSWDHTVRVWA